MLDLFKCFEVSAEGDFVPFDYHIADYALEVVVVVQFLSRGDLQLGAVAFADNAVSHHGVVFEYGYVVSHLYFALLWEDDWIFL